MIKNLKKEWKKIISFVFIFVIVLTFSNYIIIDKNTDKIFDKTSSELRVATKETRIGIVFGGGIRNNKPLPLLKDRLDTAAYLVENDLVDKLILSGDNRSFSYNEPLAMYQYLTEEKNLDGDILQPDFAGRSTYEACERASKIFKLESAVLITESTHLPRAIYLCEHFDVNSIGVKSDGNSSSGFRVGQRWRELLARSKAVFNVYIIGEETVLGEPIHL